MSTKSSSSKLTNWQRFRIWLSKFFGCKSSSYHINNRDDEHRKIESNHHQQQQSKSHDGQLIHKPEINEKSKQRKQPDKQMLPPKAHNDQPKKANDENKKIPIKSFGEIKEFEEIPYIDASLLNLDKIKK